MAPSSRWPPRPGTSSRRLVGTRLIEWGVAASKVQQLDWWESTEVHGVTLVATPAQHFSGRGLNDRNATLWASWVIRHADLNVFFTGDTGYFDGFKAIGEKYGTFDLGLHPWREPFDRIASLAAQRGVLLATPVMGQALSLKQPQAGPRWWDRVDGSK